MKKEKSWVIFFVAVYGRKEKKRKLQKIVLRVWENAVSKFVVRGDYNDGIRVGSHFIRKSHFHGLLKFTFRFSVQYTFTEFGRRDFYSFANYGAHEGAISREENESKRRI